MDLQNPRIRSFNRYSLAPSGRAVACVLCRPAVQLLIQVAIYNLKVQKLSRVVRADVAELSKADQITSPTIADFCFSGGLNTNLLVIWGSSDPVIAVYKWYSGKLVATVRDTGCFRACFDPATDLIAGISSHQIYMIVLSATSASKSSIDVNAGVRTLPRRCLVAMCSRLAEAQLWRCSTLASPA
jgi:hypothetical protein